MTPDQIARLINEDPNDYTGLPDEDQFGPNIEEIRRTGRYRDSYSVDPMRGGYSWGHDDYDGGPWETGGPPVDPRGGWSDSLEAAAQAIDEIEDELEWERDRHDEERDTIEPDLYDGAESFGAFEEMQEEDVFEESDDEDLYESLDASLDGPNFQSASDVPDDNELLDTEMDTEMDLDSSDEQEAALQTDLMATQEAEDAAIKQQQEILRPQIDDLDQQLKGIDQHALNGLDQLQGSQQELGGMDQQMASVRQLLQSLRRSV